MSFLSVMDVNQSDHALLVKLFHENTGNAAVALLQFRRHKNLREGPFLLQALMKMVADFELTVHLGILLGRGPEPVCSSVVEDVYSTIVELAM